MSILKKLCSYILFLALVFSVLSLSAGSAQAQELGRAEGSPEAWIIPIRGDIMPSMATFVRREARRAVNDGASTLIFEIDTFGGRVDTALQITSFISSLRSVRTVAWVTSREGSLGVSWSAGALIALACTEIYMAPGTSIGAAAPVLSTGESVDEKTVAAVRGQMAALAERNQHPVGLALAMVDYDVELWEAEVRGEVRALTLSELERMERENSADLILVERVILLSEPGKLLSLTAGEAYRYGLLAGLADSREDLYLSLGVAGEVGESIPSMADSIITLLTSGGVQGILILLGLVMIFLEIQSPGFGVPGTIGILAFALVFGSSALLGRVGSVEIIIFLIGLALLAVEIFIFPGFGVMGISGIVLIGVSLTLSMQDFVIPTLDWEWDLLGRNALVVFSGLLASVVGIAAIALMGPRIKLFDPIMLKTAIVGTAGGPEPDAAATKAAPATRQYVEEEEDLNALVGKIGTTDSILRLSGRATIEGNLYTVEADGEFIEAGRGIIVTRVRGNRIIVRRV